jgi:hypothetical protein
MSVQEATMPASTKCAEPVIEEASSLSRKLTIGATSSAVVQRPVACRSSRSFQIASSVSSASVKEGPSLRGQSASWEIPAQY